MEEVIGLQLKRTGLLLKALEIAKVSDNPTVEFLCKEIKDCAIKAANLLEKREQTLSRKKKICQEFVELTSKCNTLAGRSEEINEGIFLEQSHQSQLAEPAENSQVNSRNNQISSEVSPCPSDWFNGALDTPMPRGNNLPHLIIREDTQQPFIRPLKSNEMESVPGYMKGRLNCDNVNSVVAMFNSVLEQKYSIVRLKRKDVKRKDLIQYCSWKSQEEEYNMTGKIFLTAEDLVNVGNFKIDKSTDKITQVLRHTKRLRQTRVTGNVTVYIVI